MDKLTIEEERDIYKAAFEKQSECFNGCLGVLFTHGFVVNPIPECVKAWNLLKEQQHKESNIPWIEWKGGSCPVDSTTMVEIKCRKGHIGRNVAGIGNWRDGLGDATIIAYRVIQDKDSVGEYNKDFPEINVLVKSSKTTE